MHRVVDSKSRLDGDLSEPRTGGGGGLGGGVDRIKGANLGGGQGQALLV